MKKFLYAATLVMTSSLINLMALKAQAQVFINGQLIQGQELQNLQTLLGYQVPSGRYWISDTGYWGYEGNSQPLGNVLVQIQQNLTQTDNSQGAVPYYHSQGGAGGSGSIVGDPDTGCTYVSSGAMTINTCDNW